MQPKPNLKSKSQISHSNSNPTAERLLPTHMLRTDCRANENALRLIKRSAARHRVGISAFDSAMAEDSSYLASHSIKYE